MGPIEILEREWPVITGAPFLSIGGAVVLMIVFFTIGWKLKGAIDSGELRGINQRLQLAQEKETEVTRSVGEVKDQVQLLTSQVMAHAIPATIQATAGSTISTIDRTLTTTAQLSEILLFNDDGVVGRPTRLRFHGDHIVGSKPIQGTSVPGDDKPFDIQEKYLVVSVALVLPPRLSDNAPGASRVHA